MVFGMIDRTLALTPELAGVVEEAYAEFSPYSIGSALVVCHCNACMDLATERRLVATPLREIDARLLSEYTNSAHPWDDGQVAREMRYFLPRYLELIARNDPPDSMGMDICLRRLREARWRTAWPTPQADLIDRAFDALVRGALLRLDVIAWENGPELKADIAGILVLIVTAGGDLARALRVWDEGPELGAALQLAQARPRVGYKKGRDVFANAHLEDYPDAAAQIAAFLTRESVAERIEAAFFLTEAPHLQSILSGSV